MRRSNLALYGAVGVALTGGFVLGYGPQVSEIRALEAEVSHLSESLHGQYDVNADYAEHIQSLSDQVAYFAGSVCESDCGADDVPLYDSCGFLIGVEPPYQCDPNTGRERVSTGTTYVLTFSPALDTLR